MTTSATPPATSILITESEPERWLSGAAQQMLDDIEDLVGDFWDRVFEHPGANAFPRPQPGDIAWENARRDIGLELQALREGGAIPQTCPDEIVASAHIAVHAGLALRLALQCYRTGHAVQWEHLNRFVEHHDLRKPLRQAVLGRGSDFQFRWADRCSMWMEQAYTQERDQVLRGDEQQRMQAIHGLLRGDPTADHARLGYDRSGVHVAVVAAGLHAASAISELAVVTDRQELSVAGKPGVRWGWLGSNQPPTSQQWRSLLHYRPPAGTTLSIGGPCQGAEGFARAHRQAQDAARVSARRPAPITVYEDIALEALALQDEERAHAFLTAELGSLAANDPRAHVLRTTLRAYFATGQNAASAAAMLGVHERTVANRLHAAQDRLGRPAPSRQTELDTALRLHQLLNGRFPT